MAEQDLPNNDKKYFRMLLNQNIEPYYSEKYGTLTFPVVVSIAKNSPAYKAGLLENDIILKINDQTFSDFRAKLGESLANSAMTHLTILRKGQLLEKKIKGVKA